MPPLKIYYKNGRLEVTSEFVKARNRSIQLATLESVDIRRKLFFGALAICSGMVTCALAYIDLFYPHEVFLLIGFGLFILVMCWNIGTFTIYSKLTGARGWAVTWWIKPLHDMRAAVEAALEDRARLGRKRRRGGAVTESDDEEEDEEGD